MTNTLYDILRNYNFGIIEKGDVIKGFKAVDVVQKSSRDDTIEKLEITFEKDGQYFMVNVEGTKSYLSKTWVDTIWLDIDIKGF